MTDPETPETDAPDVELERYRVVIINNPTMPLHLRDGEELFLREIYSRETADRVVASLNACEGIKLPR